MLGRHGRQSVVTDRPQEPTCGQAKGRRTEKGRTGVGPTAPAADALTDLPVAVSPAAAHTLLPGGPIQRAGRPCRSSPSVFVGSSQRRRSGGACPGASVEAVAPLLWVTRGNA